MAQYVQHRFLDAHQYPSNNRLIVYADGCCLDNGRPGARAGIGVYIPSTNLQLSKKVDPRTTQTNQRAELEAIKQTLIYTQNDPRHIEIVTDSRWAIDCLVSYSVAWIRNNWQHDIKNIDLFQELFRIANRIGKPVFLRHIAGHSGDRCNDMADHLARQGAHEECYDHLNIRTYGDSYGWVPEPGDTRGNPYKSAENQC